MARKGGRRKATYAKPRRPQSRARVSTVAARLDHRIRKIENLVELKYNDELNANSNNAIALNTPYLFTINNFAEGTTQSSRVGLKVSLTSVQLKYYLTSVPSSLGPTIARVLLVYDKTPNGSTSSFDATPFGINGVIDNTTINGAFDISVAPRSYEMQYRYKVLYDKVHVLNPQWENSAGTAVLQTAKYVRKNIKLGGRQTVYQDATSAIASILKGRLSMLVYVDVGSGGVYFQCGTRVYFKDA